MTLVALTNKKQALTWRFRDWLGDWLGELAKSTAKRAHGLMILVRASGAGIKRECLLYCFEKYGTGGGPEFGIKEEFVTEKGKGAGIAQWLEPRRTRRDWKVAGSNPCWNGGRIFFSRVDFLCWLLLRYPFHPRVTTVARKKSRSYSVPKVQVAGYS